MTSNDPSDAEMKSTKESLPAIQFVSNADKFFEDLDKLHLSFKFTEKEICDLQSAVYQLVANVLQKVEDRDDRYKCSEIVRVGSYQEGTKILEPNEFDFIVVIKELSQPGKVEAVRVCTESRGYMHLRIKDNALKKRWLDFIDHDELLGFSHDNNLVKSAKGLSSILFDIYMAQTPENQVVIDKKSGILKLAGIKVLREPNTELILTWTAHEREELFQISVDVSPAVRCYNIEEAVTTDDCLDGDIFKAVCDHGSFLLTSGRRNLRQKLPSKCFRISLTEVEVKLMLNLSPVHKICYRVLKYFFANMCGTLSVRGFSYFSLSSYCLKTAVLLHLGSCKDTSQQSINSCMESILSFILNCLDSDIPNQRPVLPSIFIKDHNLFESLTRYQTGKNIALNLVMHVQCLLVLRSLINTLKSLPSSDYCFSNYFETFHGTLTDLETGKGALIEKAKQFINSHGQWEATVSVKDLLSHFGVPQTSQT